ncbi:hypothetical protein NCG97_27370 [Streptomyces lydicamycinicus]|uniref:hypothetical protein n=1 Tax=Streptomyces lydicamycinicus TaxID=1546107 RepID=UPI002036566A|nr:hypothetical protein [Streptomyces lydicamycinicus]USA05493.1 hypothetical protein NCG97_27370 [Streptomyces lydicamycinicus]
MPQPERGPHRCRDGGQRLVQREFIGAAGPREQPQPPDQGQCRQYPARLSLVRQRQPQGPLADQVVAGLGGRAALRRQPAVRAAQPGPGQGALDQTVCGQDPAVAAQRRGQHEVGEADEPWIVLDDGRLGPFDIGPGAFVHGHGLEQPFAK